MKRLFLLLALCLILAAPVSATMLDFQNYGDYNSSINKTAGTYYSGSSLTSSGGGGNITGGNSYVYTRASAPTGRVYLTGAYPSSYSAATIPYRDYNWGGATVQLLDNNYNIMATLGEDCMSNPCLDHYNGNGISGGNARVEIVVVGTTAYMYWNGILVRTATGISQYPSYVSYTSGGVGTAYDDIIWGGDDRVVLGMPAENGYYIKKDFVNPASSGLFNYTTEALVSSTVLTTSFSRSNLSDSRAVNESIYLINRDTGTVYQTRYTANRTWGAVYWDLAAFVASGAPYGFYQMKLNTTLSDPIMYVADGAQILFDKDDYLQQDTATLTYEIYADYWDTSTYSYSAKIYDANTWNVVYSQGISASTGTLTYQFTSDDDQGVYYAVLVATPNAGGADIWMYYDYATLQSYVEFSGYVNAAQTGLPISGANVSFVQSDIIANSITTAYGNYTAGGFVTGVPLIINVTKSGYFQYYVSLTPMTAKAIPLNITLNSTTPSYTGIGVGGIDREGVLTGTTITGGYGQPIEGVANYIENASFGDYCTNQSSMTGWYLFDESNGCILMSGRLYSIWGSLAGYDNSTVYQVVV